MWDFLLTLLNFYNNTITQKSLYFISESNVQWSWEIFLILDFLILLYFNFRKNDMLLIIVNIPMKIKNNPIINLSNNKTIKKPRDI